jgi:hypothetical protein
MRFIIVHSRTATINADTNDPTPVEAHCFGPFASLEAAADFEYQAPDDCFKVAVPLTGPAIEDIEAMEEAMGTGGLVQ